MIHYEGRFSGLAGLNGLRMKTTSYIVISKDA
jgi:hypothetical protein